MKRWRLILSLGALVLASNAGAQALPEQLARATRDSIQVVIDQSAARGLPTDALYAKAAEGVLKRATDARILLAVRNLARSLAEARAALPPQASEPTIVAAASALQAGVERDIISRYAAVSKRGEADLAVAFVTLADLIASDVPRAAASQSVEQLLRTGIGDAEMTSFRAAVARDIQSGTTPLEALTARAKQFGKP